MRLRNLCILAVLPLVMAGQCQPGAGLTCPTLKNYSDAYIAEASKELDMIGNKAPYITGMLKDYGYTQQAIRACIKRKKK